MSFTPLKLVGRHDCSFEIPDFQSVMEERAWAFTLTTDQPMKLLRGLNDARWGKEWTSKKINREHIEVLTMEEFNRINAVEHLKEQTWLAEA